MTETVSNKENRTALVVVSIFMLCYALGLLFPDSWWGTHYVAFLPSPFNYLFFILALFLAFFGKEIGSKLKFPSTAQNPTKTKSTLLIIGIGVLAGIIFYHFPIVNDNYGDAVRYGSEINTVLTEIPPNFIEDILNFEVLTFQF